MFHRFVLLVITLLLPLIVYARDLEKVQKIWTSSSGPSAWRKLVIELVDAGHYFSAVPYMKEYLVQNKASLDEDLDEAFDKMITHTGIRPFEALPENILDQSRSSVVRYILAKKYFRKARWEDSLGEIARVDVSHPVYPFAIHLRAAIKSIKGKSVEAESDFRDCISFSNSRYKVEPSPVKLRQLLINRDTCVAGLARAHFGREEYSKADILYLDIPKSSYIWPDILIEEAWSSYYLKNYNRTLGKLVSYKAPIFDFIFNPEIDVLKSLAYLRMCLYADATEITENFYSRWLEPSKELRSFILSHGRDSSYYYQLVVTFEKERVAKDFLMQSLLLSITKDPAWQEMKQAYIDAIVEFEKIKSLPKTRLTIELLKNIKDVVSDYQKLLGSFARSQFYEKYQGLSKAFQGMSFIKLEVLSRKKQSLYEEKNLNGKRGDVRYVERNEKQYFWDFNGEFWADELGDYVFALRSEC